VHLQHLAYLVLASTLVANRGSSHGFLDVVLETCDDFSPEKGRGGGDANSENVSGGTEWDEGVLVCSMKGSCGDIIL